MQYDPIKDIFSKIIKRFPPARILFYKILDIMFLRAWYVKRELRNLRNKFGSQEIQICDAGTGYGQYSNFMLKNLMPCRIYAVDIKKNWIEDARDFYKKKNINTISFGIEDLTEIDYENRFDLIISIDVMEHIEEDIKVFENFYKALVPGGFLIINTPSNLGGSDAHAEDDESFIAEHARSGYSKEDLESKLNSAGFGIYKFTYTYGRWGNIAWRLGIKYPMLSLNASRIFFILLPFYYLLILPFTFLFMAADYYSFNKKGSGINLIAQKK
ncbi:MAG TPA: class I SAM-dependent methyltransferase [Ignavibacteriaceae bacterium]|nr:class I SAM-dependent methyltransferase [Ignavibacteriaceae bacterium]